MTNETLTTERILEVTEEVLRRFGPAKTTVIDVARALGVSHGSIYRHYPSKAALINAVAERWLDKKLVPLSAIVHEEGPASERLWRWLSRLCANKHANVLEEPELFATYMGLAAEIREVSKAHVAHLIEQIASIISDGIAQGEFASTDPIATGQAILDATMRFHAPAHAAEWSDPEIEIALERVWSLLLSGLRPRDIPSA